MTGRELDARVAEEVMGVSLESLCSRHRIGQCDGTRHTVCGTCGAQGHGNCYGDGHGQIEMRCEMICFAPAFSEEFAPAFEVWEKLVSESPDGWAIFSDGVGAVTVEFFGDGYTGDREAGAGDFSVDGPLPRAICEAALLKAERG